ncbi:MAG: ABC transporter permease [Variibacter sp.]|nr:ABC transporter permease [Variibacter sp.]
MRQTKGRERVASATSLAVSLSAGTLTFAASGAWVAEHAHALERLVDAAAGEAGGAGPTVLQAEGITSLDTYGAWLIERLARGQAARGRDLAIVGLAPHYHGLIDQVRETNRAAAQQRARGAAWLRGLESVGRRTEEALQSLSIFLHMLGAVGLAVARVSLHPARFRLTSTVHHLDRVGWRAVPIVLLITFLIGAIIAQQGIFHFRKFGADDYVVDLVGILVLREIGVLIVAIMVAGRSGSSYTAELGSMKMREEIDALRTMGFDPVEVLILPRVLALVCALPILAFLGAMSALYGGLLVAWLYGGMSPAIFIDRLREAISVTHFEVGMIKAPFMALAIGVVACSEGLRVKGSAESLGLQTTTSVVKSIFLVIVLDGVFAMFFASIGM